MKTKLREKKVRLFGKSIPLIAVVAVVFMVGIASAAVIASLSATVVPREPTTAEITDDLEMVLPAVWDPGDSDDVELTIDNIADRGYGLIVTADVTYSLAGDATITVGAPGGDVTDDGEADDVNYNIAAAADDTADTEAEGTLTYTVTLEEGAESGGDLSVSFEVERVAIFP